MNDRYPRDVTSSMPYQSRGVAEPSCQPAATFPAGTVRLGKPRSIDNGDGTFTITTPATYCPRGHETPPRCIDWGLFGRRLMLVALVLSALSALVALLWLVPGGSP